VRIVYEHLHVKPVPPSQLNPALSLAIEKVVLRCLEKDPSQRYQSVAEVYDALNDAIGTPSVSLDSDELTGAREKPQEAERVPTGVGGVSRAVPEDEYALAREEDDVEEGARRITNASETPNPNAHPEK
jgi:serine/threonine-protein kinase